MESKESDNAKVGPSEETDQTSPKQTAAATSMPTEKVPEGKATGDKTSENKLSARLTVRDGKVQPSSGKPKGGTDTPILTGMLESPIISPSEFAAGTVTLPIAKYSKVKIVEMTDEGRREDSNVKDVEMTDEGGREDLNVKDVEMTDEGGREDSNVKDVEMTDGGRRGDCEGKDVEMTDGQREDPPPEAVKTARGKAVEVACRRSIFEVVRDLVECAEALTRDYHQIDMGLKSLKKNLGATRATIVELGLPTVEPRPAADHVDQPESSKVQEEQKTENEHVELPAADLSTSSSDDSRSPLVKKPKVGTEEDL